MGAVSLHSSRVARATQRHSASLEEQSQLHLVCLCVLAPLAAGHRSQHQGQQVQSGNSRGGRESPERVKCPELHIKTCHGLAGKACCCLRHLYRQSLPDQQQQGDQTIWPSSVVYV